MIGLLESHVANMIIGGASISAAHTKSEQSGYERMGSP
jgi:hypothetical protein